MKRSLSVKVCIHGACLVTAITTWMLPPPAIAQSKDRAIKRTPVRTQTTVLVQEAGRGVQPARTLQKSAGKTPPLVQRLPHTWSTGKTSLVRRVPGTSLVSAGPQPEPPAGPVEMINFDKLPSRTATSSGQTLRNEYRQAGVSFPDGIAIYRSGGNEVQRAHSGSMAAASLQHGEFANEPLKVQFTQPQKKVSLYVMLIRSGAGKGAVAKLEAFNSSGRHVAQKNANFRSDGRNWTRLEVTSTAANIKDVTLTGGSTEFPNTNFLLIDDLSFSGGTAPAGTAADRQAPVISILEPAANTRTLDRLLRARVRITENEYLSEVSYRLVRDGSAGNDRWLRLAGGVNDPPPDKLLERTWDLQFPSSSSTGHGWYTFTVRATDIAGNKAERSVRINLQAPPATDAWVLGMEYNQGYQDVIYTDLDRGAVTGWVPLQHPTGRDTRLALPIIPGKPMLVRVYVGLRGTPTPPPNGVPVTGRLRVEAPETGGPGRTIRPLNSNDCFSHLGTRMPSLHRVIAFGTLGTQGFRTQSPYCIDLIAARIHFAGTLNFVIPADFTERLRRGAELRVTVEPVGYRETNPGDNQFRMSLQNVYPRQTAKIRLVRLSPDGIPAPSEAAARQVIRDMTQFTKYSQIDIVSDQVFRYRRSTVQIEAELLGLKVVRENLDEGNSLWLMLAQRYGLRKDETLVALLPRGLRLRDTRVSGIGWRIPKLQPLRGATGGPVQPDYYGGVAWALMPDAAGRNAYWDQVSTVAHEFYHAHLDVRHEETGHGESEGTFLSGRSGASFLEFGSDLAGFNIDFDASKPASHKNGVIGEYPTASVELGQPGSPTGHFAGVIDGSSNRNMPKVIGFLGGTGVRIELIEGRYQLTLYDPCPTGQLDRSNPRRVLRQRINSNSQYDPQMDDSRMPHGFMSYSSNRWITGRHSPNIMNLNHAY